MAIVTSSKTNNGFIFGNNRTIQFKHNGDSGEVFIATHGETPKSFQIALKQQSALPLPGIAESRLERRVSNLLVWTQELADANAHPSREKIISVVITVLRVAIVAGAILFGLWAVPIHPVFLVPIIFLAGFYACWLPFVLAGADLNEFRVNGIDEQDLRFDWFPPWNQKKNLEIAKQRQTEYLANDLLAIYHHLHPEVTAARSAAAPSGLSNEQSGQDPVSESN